MKIRLNFLLICFIFSLNLYSQDSSSFRIGIKTGINLSYITGVVYYDAEYHKKFGFNFAVIADRKINTMSSMQFEILYNDAGSKWGEPIFDMGYDGDYVIYNMKYISINGYWKLKSRIGNLIKDFDFALGGSISYNIYSKQKNVDRLPIGDIGFPAPADFRDDINKFEFGILYGIKIPLYSRIFYINFLHYLAITSLYPNNYPSYDIDIDKKSDMRNNCISISFDYFFITN